MFWIGSTRRRVPTSIGLPATSLISESMYSSFFSAGQSAYRPRQSDCGLSQTANVSAKSSSGWLCAYQLSRCNTKLLL